jgi:hypothetical protein
MTLSQYNPHCIFYCDPIKNSIMNDGNFIRIIYATQNITLNGIILQLQVNITGMSKYYNKYKYSIDISNVALEQIKTIEYDLLNKNHYCHHKKKQYNLYEHVSSRCIKTCDDYHSTSQNSMFLLKISGIWETESECGVTYKFILM